MLRLNNKNNYLINRSINDSFKYKTWVDSMGRLHAQQAVLTKSLNEIDNTMSLKVDSLSKLLKIKPKDVKGITEISFTTEDHFTSKIKDNFFNHSDSFFNISGFIDSDNLSISYYYRDSATITHFKNRKTFLGVTYSAKDYIDVYFCNPKTIIKGLRNVDLSQYQSNKHFIIGPTAGLLYDGQWRPYFGIGVTYKLIQF